MPALCAGTWNSAPLPGPGADCNGLRQLSGGLAEFERSLICARTGEGRERAKARGVALRGHDAGEAATEMPSSLSQSSAAMISPGLPTASKFRTWMEVVSSVSA
jgi:hypothetical protein